MKKFALLVTILIIAASGCVDSSSKTVSIQTPVAPVVTEEIASVPTVTNAQLPESSNLIVQEGDNRTSEDGDNNTIAVNDDVAIVDDTVIIDDSNDTSVNDINTTVNNTSKVVVSGPSWTTNNVEKIDPDARIYGVGSTIENGNTRMTLNSIRYADTIDDKGSGHNIAQVDPGNKFIVLNITIRNIGNDTNISYDGSKFVILDMDASSERIYEEDIVSSEGWLKHFTGTEISPGDVRQGELAYQVPEDIGELQLKFEYYSESSDGTTLEMFTLK